MSAMQTQPLMPQEQLVENVEKLLEIGVVEWIGLSAPDVLTFLLANPWICGACGQRHHWFIAREDSGVLCEVWDRARRISDLRPPTSNLGVPS